MADDEKIIRIEGELREKRSPGEPAGARHDETALPVEPDKPIVFDELEKAIQGPKQVWEIIKKIRETISRDDADDLPINKLPEPPPSPPTSSTADVTAAGADAYTYTATTDEFMGAGASNASAGTAEAASTAAEGATAAGATTAGEAGAAGAAIAPLVEEGAVAIAITEAAGFLVETLGPVGAVVAGVVIGLGLFGLVINKTTELLTEMFDSLSQQWEGLSPAMAQARGEQEARLTLRALENESDVGPEAAEVIEAQTDIGVVLTDIKAFLIVLIGPILRDLLFIVKAILYVVKAILSVFYLFIWLDKALKHIVRWFLSWIPGINKLLGDSEDKPNDALFRSFQGLRSVITSQKDDLHRKGRYPVPHSGKVVL